MSKILLIDGSNYLFRAFHGLPDLRTSSGEPTGAVRGFLGMLGKVWALAKPDHAVIIFDAQGKNFRHEMFPEYKSNRPPMPDDLRVQIEPLHGILKDLGWPVVSVPGVEADDVIATIAEKARAAGMKSIIATGDKDMAQLVDDDIVLINTMNVKFYDREGVIEKYGVPPERIVDYLSLMGDKVDNVPGIEKCGPKTAAKWIAEYGDLEGVKAHAGEVKGKAGEYLRAGLAFLDDARRLTTICRTVKLPEGCVPEALVVKPADPDAVSAFCRRWEMSLSTLKRAAPSGIGASAEPAATGTAEPDDLGGLFSREAFAAEALAAKPAPKPAPAKKAAPAAPVMQVSFSPALAERPDELPVTEIADRMTLELFAGRLLDESRAMPVALTMLWDGDARHAEPAALGVALSIKDVFVIRFTEELPVAHVMDVMRPWLEGSAAKVAHDAKTLAHVFLAQGVRLGGMLHDTMLMSYVLEAHLKHELPLLAARSLARSIPTRESVVGKGAKAIAAKDADPKAVVELLGEEAAAIRALHAVLMTRLDLEDGLMAIYETLEQPLIGVLGRMEEAGVALDDFRLSQQSEALTVRIDGLVADAYKAAGHEFNLSSPKQLAQVLFTELGLPSSKKTGTGTPSTDEEVLTELALDYPLPKLILEHRRLTKLKSTYLDKLPRMVDPKDGRVHTTFGQAVAVTGRLASSDPNLQNIPIRNEDGKEIRKAFIPDEGSEFFSADYSQIELRIMAHLSNDPHMIEAFQKDQDIHAATAAKIYKVKLEEVTREQRSKAKTANFGIIYGISVFGLAERLNVDRKEAKALIDGYFENYPNVKAYMDQSIQEAREKGYIETIFKRKRYLPDINSKNAVVRGYAERNAINAPIQGSAADIIKVAMIRIYQRFQEEGIRSKMILQVHDELNFSVLPEEKEKVQQIVISEMEAAYKMKAPLRADHGWGHNWLEAH